MQFRKTVWALITAKSVGPRGVAVLLVIMSVQGCNNFAIDSVESDYQHVSKGTPWHTMAKMLTLYLGVYYDDDEIVISRVAPFQAIRAIVVDAGYEFDEAPVENLVTLFSQNQGIALLADKHGEPMLCLGVEERLGRHLIHLVRAGGDPFVVEASKIPDYSSTPHAWFIKNGPAEYQSISLGGGQLRVYNNFTNFGVLDKGDEAVQSVTIENAGTRNTSISKAWSSCNCTVPSNDVEGILSGGERRTFQIRIKDRNGQAFHQSVWLTASVETESGIWGPPQNIQVELFGFSSANVTVAPLRVDFGSVYRGEQEIVRDITLRSSGYADFSVVRVDSKKVAVTYLEVPQRSSGDLVTKLSLSPTTEELPPGKYSDSLVIHTLEGAQLAEHVVPFTLNIRKNVEPVSSIVSFGEVQINTENVKYVDLNVREGEICKIRAPKVHNWTEVSQPDHFQPTLKVVIHPRSSGLSREKISIEVETRWGVEEISLEILAMVNERITQ